MKHMLDLYAGLGGASESMIQNGWSVLRIDNNILLQNVENMFIADIPTMNIFKKPLTIPQQKIDLVWASPPCVEFSLGYSSPRSQAIRDGEGDTYQPDMTHVLASMQIIDAINPRYWVIENVRGATKYFNPILGKPRQTFGNAIMLWGNFPLIQPGAFKTKGQNDVWSDDPLRANKKAVIPYEISDALRLAIEQQTSILDFA
tara:strand:+ start:3641 stop:4246 length:606 start_codon:yes stop_codon:yes gene_type:complete